jgi:vacuolar-type H+-ATPase subunit D/Vma8
MRWFSRSTGTTRSMSRESRRSVVLISDELALTRQQQRALEMRWIPELRRQLTVLAQRLDEAEREENLRLRWAARRRGGER